MEPSVEMIALLVKAGQYCCAGQVRWLIEIKKFEAAKATVAKAMSIIERSRAFGVEVQDEVRICISHGQSEKAADLLTAAERARAFEDLTQGFKVRVKSLSKPGS